MEKGAINAISGATMPFKYVDGTFNNMNNLPIGVTTVDFANMANVPSGGWGYGVVITAKIADNSNFKTQTAYCTKGSSAGEKNIFMRQQWGGTWGDWERLVSETDIQHVNYSLSAGSDSGHITIENGHCDILFNTDWSDSAIWFVLRGSYGGRVVILKSSTATNVLTVAFTSDSTYKISNPSGSGTVVHRVSL